MSGTYTAVVKQESGWWIGWIEEIPGVNCQEITREALLASLVEALSCHPEQQDLARNKDGVDAPSSAGGDWPWSLNSNFSIRIR